MSIARHHTEWLSLVPVSGPFLSLPVLLEAFSAGLEPHDPDHVRLLRQEFTAWQETTESRRYDPVRHQAWIRFVLSQTLDLDDQVLREGQGIAQTLQVEVPEHHELLRPNFVVADPQSGKPRLLIQTYSRSQDLSSYVSGSTWKASPDTRMTELLHGTGVRLGLVTNGEHWMLVDAPKGETSGYASWYASLWLDEPITLRAFRSLLSVQRFFGVPDDQTLESLLAKSASNQQEVTDQLGYQVRKAVEVLIHSLDKADQDFGRELLAEVTPEQLYESALTVMMRLVFLFCAEERELIPSKPFPVYEQNYSVCTISRQLRELADQHGEELLERRYDAWQRLLAAFRAVYGGLKHDDVQIPAYGGNLFNPDRFPFLEGRKRGTCWRDVHASPLPVNNRTVLHLLEALQLLQIKVPGGGAAEARRLSFRSLDIEQIGHVYEGLLDHTAKRATEPVLGLVGTRDKEPEIPLAELESRFDKLKKTIKTIEDSGLDPESRIKRIEAANSEFYDWLKDETGKSATTLRKSLNVELDSHDAGRFRTACQSDDRLWKRVEPLAGLVRQDTFGYPVVIPVGSIFVTSGNDRRSSGTHYTPRSLTEPIVQYTLEPLVYVGPAEGLPKSEWRLKSAKELLALKICDMACGSGAFLVQAARYMAERLLEAWEHAKQANPATPGITPEGMPSTGKADEALIPDDPAERKTYAMRIIAQRCLYGVDKNPLAVEMAKLSLWLLTMAKDKPFEFLDHSIRSGDSLVGLHSIDQLRHFSLKPDADDAVLFRGPLDDAVDEAIELRLRLEDLPANTVEDVQHQEQLLAEANEKIARLRCAADLLVAAEYWGENAKDKLERVRHAAVVSGHYVEHGPTQKFQQAARKAWENRGSAAEVRGPGSVNREASKDVTNNESRPPGHASRPTLQPFHWPLEFPEVIVKRGGFDAFVGNPPFVGGRRIRSNFGLPYLTYLSTTLVSDGSANADLCAFFFVRAFSLLETNGTFGLLATNSISQGDTMSVGLSPVCEIGSVYRAVSSMTWPGTANVYVAKIWASRRDSWGTPILDGMPVEYISAALTATLKGLGAPHNLFSNKGTSFQGSIVLGMGFVLAPEEAQRLIQKDPRNTDVLFPYLNGEDLNGSVDQSPSRWVINFFDWPVEKAMTYPDCFKIIQERVQPERTRLKANGEYALRKPLPQKWWIYADKRPALYAKLSAMKRVLVRPQVSRTHAPVFYTPGIVFSMMVIVLTLDEDGQFAVVQSNLFESWLDKYSSSLKNDRRFTPSDSFENFAFPNDTKSADKVGSAYNIHRREIMDHRQEGLTKTYNRFHKHEETSADIRTLRLLHTEMDQAVAAAYGWTDLDLGHGFYETKQGIRFTISEPARREVLQRLLKLNHERYAEEVKQGLHGKKGGAGRVASGGKKAAGGGKAAAKKADATGGKKVPSLFGEEDV